MLSTIPVWVRFASLHLKFWSQKVLSKVFSLIGKPLYMDNATATWEKIAYARCFIEMSASSIFLGKVSIELEGEEKLKLKGISESPIMSVWFEGSGRK